jgi:hypothetical protein
MIGARAILTAAALYADCKSSKTNFFCFREASRSCAKHRNFQWVVAAFCAETLVKKIPRGAGA